MSLNFFSGLVRRLTVPSYSDQAVQPTAMNQRGEMVIAQGLPERSELSRFGSSFSAQILAANKFDTLASIPTTLAELSLQNASAVGGKSFIIDRFWFKNIITTTSLMVMTPISQVVVPGTALVADSANITRISLSGVAPASNSQIALHSTATGCIGDKWNHHQSLELRATTNIAHVVEVQCYGRYVIPPGGNFSINLEVSVATAAAGLAGIEWHEIQL